MSRGGGSTVLAFLLSLATIVVPSNAIAGEPPDALAWRQEWPTFRPAEYVFTGIAGALSAAAYFGVQDPAHPRWTGGILFDDAARDAFRLRSRSARAAIQKTSDVTAIASAVLVLGVDSLIVPLARKSDFVALQLILMDAESFVVSSLINTTVYKATGRARPSFADCTANPSYDGACRTEPTVSFPSGHANAAFTAAGLACAHHAYLPLYGSRVADAFGCGAQVTLAVATSAFRVMGDRHYVSDVLVGGALGFGIGFAGPILLHYDVPGRAGAKVASIAPTGDASTMGFVVSGQF